MEGKSQKEIRLLKPDEIECRIGTVSEKGVSLLLYKDARVDQKILDETFGAFGWKRSHQVIDGNLYCTVEVRSENGEWIGKQDVGTMGKTEQEKEKPQASDSFKRACVNWGIGRELYSAPFIWIPSQKANVQKDGNRYKCMERFHVAGIGYSESREISSLTIFNGRGEQVYVWKSLESRLPENLRSQAGNTGTGCPKPSVTPEQIQSFQKELERTGVTMEAVTDRFHVNSVEEMSPEVYQKVMKALGITKGKAA